MLPNFSLWLLRLYARAFFFLKWGLKAGDLPGWGRLSRLAVADTVLNVEGVKIFFDHRATGNYLCHLAGRFNEPETHYFINKILNHIPFQCHFFDIGANVGEMALDFARHPRIQK